MKFTDKLLTASRRNNSLLCVGLDPDPELVPKVSFLEFNKAIIEATADLVCACLLYTSPSPRDGLLSRMPSSA